MAILTFVVVLPWRGIVTAYADSVVGVTSQFMHLVVRPPRDVDRLVDGMIDYSGQFRPRRPAEYAARRVVNG